MAKEKWPGTAKSALTTLVSNQPLPASTTYIMFSRQANPRPTAAA